ncbi:hypothetical protein [Flavobacterium sp. TAB 87]|uniref:hypothetical protein n=1 Tax=Flavobacterium sp. TAB 87 TaxID=1729581 RepID=UPI00076C2EF1|nr:hypothetical protein [Flavobacterium sp. TAB 87]KVV13723.1 hypothetical protein AP058_03090 [Flavobacterium sp. TAB 87]
MSYKKALLLVLILFLIGCKSKPTNQTINKKKEGLWITESTIDRTKYKFVERYKNNIPVKTWKEFINDKLYKRETYKSDVCKVKYLHSNGKRQSKGITRLEVTTKESHWFYTGRWKFYSDEGKLIKTKNYKNGELLSEENIN